MPNFLIDEDTGLIAAEFVLGTLDSAERANAHSLLKVDHGFIAMVRIWERRFGDLHLMVEPVDPNAKIFERIKAKLPVTAGEPAATADAPKAAPPPPSVDPSTSPAAAPEAVPPAPASTPAVADSPKSPDAAVTTDAPKAPDAPKPPDAPPPVTAPAAEVTPAPATTLPPAPDFPPTAPRLPEEKPKNGRTPLPKAGGLPAPPPQPPAPLKLPNKPPDRFQERGADRRSEVTIDIIRSRRRWRAFGIFMILLLYAKGGLVAAWKTIPDRLPPALRPSTVMMVIGIEPQTPAAPERKQAPPESQFDE
jgi:hypothetical protein